MPNSGAKRLIYWVLQNTVCLNMGALKTLQAMLLKLWLASGFCTHLGLSSKPYYLHVWGVHAPTDWHHVMLCALNYLKQNLLRDNWIPLIKRATAKTLHEGSADDLAHCLTHAFFIQETRFLDVFSKQLRGATIRFVVSLHPFRFLHETTSTERICVKMNIRNFYQKNVLIVSSFSESRVK
jgi:hypothetical protein